MEIQRRLAETDDLNVSPPLTKVGNSLGIDIPPDAFWAKITGSGTDANSVTVYSWTEQFMDSGGNWVDMPGGRSGTPDYYPAYEVNHASGVGDGTIVEMRQGFFNCGNVASTGLEYLFAAPLSGGGSTPSTAPVTFGGPVNFGGQSYYKPNSWLTIGLGVGIGIYSPIWLSFCLRMAGPAGVPPVNPPIVTWGASGDGQWKAATHTVRITLVDYTGAEGSPSTAVSTTTPDFSPLGAKMTVQLNNSSVPTGTKFWRVYVSPDNVSGSEVAQPIGEDGDPVYDIPIATTSVLLPGPWQEGKDLPTVPSDPNEPWSCFLPPTCCGKPTWTGEEGDFVEDLCQNKDSEGNTIGKFPTFWVYLDGSVAPPWQNVIGLSGLGQLISHNGIDTKVVTPPATDFCFFMTYAASTKGVGHDWTAALNTDGKLLIGDSTGKPKVSLPTSSDNTITITAGHGTLDFKVNTSSTPIANLTAGMMSWKGPFTVGFAALNASPQPPASPNWYVDAYTIALKETVHQVAVFTSNAYTDSGAAQVGFDVNIIEDGAGAVNIATGVTATGNPFDLSNGTPSFPYRKLSTVTSSTLRLSLVGPPTTPPLTAGSAELWILTAKAG